MIFKNKLYGCIKWCGGKNRSLNIILANIPQFSGTYYEPFLGGGSVLFALKPEQASVNDCNVELVNFYQVLKNNINEFLSSLKDIKISEEFFYQLRNKDRDPEYLTKCSPIERAIRFLYINRVGFNGLYRTNKQGFCNVPFGKKKEVNFQIDRLIETSEYLSKNNVSLSSLDFEEHLKTISKGDFVYLDSPYIPLSSSENFVSYTKDGFGDKDHQRLKDLCDDLTNKGIKFLQSNSCSKAARKLYSDYNIQEVCVNRLLGGKGSHRREVKEILISNY